MSRYACGMERSSGGASVLVLDIDSRKVVYRNMFSYDDAFGDRYDIHGGVLRSDSGERHAPQRMLLEAQQALFDRMKGDGFDIPEIVVYKEDDMQHALAFTRRSTRGLERTLRNLDPGRTLAEQIGPHFSRETTHIWEDRTTGDEVAYLNEKLQPYGGMVALTGNPAELRFPAAQLLKWIRERPEEYMHTGLIQPLSAFGTSVLAGKVAPVDTGDGWGTNMNTMNINNPGWCRTITDLIDPALIEKLCGMTHYDTRIGNISRYFVERYGADPDAYVLAGTGDNPAYLLPFFISAGTSWTVNGGLPGVARSNGEDNVFGCRPGRAMSLVCFTNGGRLHREFRDRYAGGSWDRYHELAAVPYPGVNIMLPYLLDESVPRRKAGIVRDGFDDSDGSANIRALYDSQVLAARLHSKHMNIPPEIWVVGGGGKSPVLRQTVADVFGKPVKTLQESEFAAVLGNAMAGAADFLNIPYEDAIAQYAAEMPNSRTEPMPQNAAQYREALARYAELEKRAIA